jgi:NAD kinase
VADDGRSGVAATAAAAVSVALAQSWAAVAGGKSSVMPHRDVANDSIPERARFKLVAAVPRNVKPHREVSSPSPQVPLRPAPPGIPRSGSQQSIANGGDGGMALESLDDAQVLDDRQEATWRASGGHLKLHWLSPPKTALVVYKPTDEVVEATGRAIAWLLTRGLIVYVEPEAHGEIHRVTLQLLQDVCQAQASGTTAMERTESTGSAVFGSISPRSPSALEAEHKREATTDTAANAVELLQRSLMTWPSGAAGCDHVLPGDVANRFDMVLTLGGDGTVLWACSLFGREAIPPLVPLAMGSLGFMTPFPLNRMDSVLSRVTSVAAGFPLMLRHRLQCRIVRAGEPGDDQVPGIATNPFLAPAPCGDDVLVLNEVVIDRGMTSTLANVQCFVDKNFVTSVQGDGLIVSTPTGSTAYNLAAGGSMVHPAVPCILFTPICPHTLSSRPVVFPEHVTLHVKVPSDSRFEAYCSFDGRARRALRPGDSVFIQLSQRPVPMVCNRDATHDCRLYILC